MFSKLDFVGRWKLWFAISAVLVSAGIANHSFQRPTKSNFENT